MSPGGLITTERIIEVLENGCPKCGEKDRVVVDTTDHMRHSVSLDGEYVEWCMGNFLQTVSFDYIICTYCFWQEPEE